MTRRRERPRRVVVDARAKLNLALAVGPRRRDGFHDLTTVFQSITLHDTLVAERARSFSLRVRCESAAVRGRWRERALPGGRTNLVLRAARLARARLGLPGAARFTLVKRIPSQAGMGGGSADAAAALVAMSRLYGVRAGRDLFQAIAIELGSDVPFALVGGTALGRGRGERLTPLRLRQPLRLVVAMPAWRISTAAAFRRLDRSNQYLTSRWHHRRFAQAIGPGGISEAGLARLGNTFEVVLGAHRSSFEDLCARLALAGACRPRLTGSGSAVFAEVPDRSTPSGVVRRFTGSEPLFVARSAARGLRIRRQP